ncbi:MAG: 50S ribosomal protein L6 [Nitrospirota bacterium]|nr:MAG: 50S ribosomal protein L6 [Nitrospirota bacterium]
MSRIGKQPIDIPSGVDVKISNRQVSIKGPKGQLQWEHPDVISVDLKDNKMHVTRPDDSKPKRALHGLTRSLIASMVTGVVDGFKKDLELVGVGYRVQLQGNKLVFSLGYSHPVEFHLPDGITAEVDKKQTQISISGIDKQLVGQVAANIKEIRLPDAYKGKGVRYADERIKLKPGKTAK